MTPDDYGGPVGPIPEPVGPAEVSTPLLVFFCFFSPQSKLVLLRLLPHPLIMLHISYTLT